MATIFTIKQAGSLGEGLFTTRLLKVNDLYDLDHRFSPKINDSHMPDWIAFFQGTDAERANCWENYEKASIQDANCVMLFGNTEKRRKIRILKPIRPNEQIFRNYSYEWIIMYYFYAKLFFYSFRIHIYTSFRKVIPLEPSEAGDRSYMQQIPVHYHPLTGKPVEFPIVGTTITTNLWVFVMEWMISLEHYTALFRTSFANTSSDGKSSSNSVSEENKQKFHYFYQSQLTCYEEELRRIEMMIGLHACIQRPAVLREHSKLSNELSTITATSFIETEDTARPSSATKKKDTKGKVVTKESTPSDEDFQRAEACMAALLAEEETEAQTKALQKEKQKKTKKSK